MMLLIPQTLDARKTLGAERVLCIQLSLFTFVRSTQLEYTRHFTENGSTFSFTNKDVDQSWTIQQEGEADAIKITFS